VIRTADPYLGRLYRSPDTHHFRSRAGRIHPWRDVAASQRSEAETKHPEKSFNEPLTIALTNVVDENDLV